MFLKLFSSWHTCIMIRDVLFFRFVRACIYKYTPMGYHRFTPKPSSQNMYVVSKLRKKTVNNLVTTFIMMDLNVDMQWLGAVPDLLDTREMHLQNTQCKHNIKQRVLYDTGTRSKTKYHMLLFYRSFDIRLVTSSV